jgi:hypothetical protein
LDPWLDTSAPPLPPEPHIPGNQQAVLAVLDMFPNVRTEAKRAEILNASNVLEVQGNNFHEDSISLQCEWCKKWRFVHPEVHEIEQHTDENLALPFYCHALRWKQDQTLVGLSCAISQQLFDPPCPFDPALREEAAVAMAKFWAWVGDVWEQEDIPNSTDTAGRTQMYCEDYWRYLWSEGVIVPEGVHPEEVED